MASKTPVRIRGKRTATSPEKWRAQKRRKVDDDGSSRSCASASNSTPSASLDKPSNKRKRGERELSRLEQLPTEVIQTIFEYTANVNLAVISPRLTSQLSSTHMYHRLTTQILVPVCSPLGNSRATTTDSMRAATRLLDCKFFTWPFMCSWLDNECKRLSIPNTYRNGKEKPYWQLWNDLKPAPKLLPPHKLLRASWTDNDRNLLELFMHNRASQMLLLDHPLLLEIGQVGMTNAIKAGATEVVGYLVDLGIYPDTEQLRDAVVKVVDEGCDDNIVYNLLVGASASSTCRRDGITVADIYNPTIWALVERARANGNPKGDALLDMLKDAAYFDKNRTPVDPTVSRLRLPS